MKALLGIITVAVCGWAVWSYVVRPVVASPVVPTPTVTVAHPTATPLPDLSGQAPQVAGRAASFLSDWSAGHFGAMYDLLSPAARGRISRSAFTRRYQAITAEATIVQVRPVVGTASVQSERASVTYSVNISTTAVGTIRYSRHMPLTYAQGRWGIDWTPGLIFPGLDNPAYRVHLFTEPTSRGSIVDRLGQPFALEGNVLTVGVVPQYIADERGLLAFMSRWLHMPAASIRAAYHVAWAVQNPTDFVPITTVTSPQWAAVPAAKQQELLNNGLDIQKGASRRIYPKGSLASALIGYVNSTDGHGSAGLERWADGYLSGHDGTKLAIATAPDFAYIASTIKERPVSGGATIHLTLDSTLQAAAEKALAGRVGAVVALRPSDGAVLAMASTPGYDPNQFATGLTQAQYDALINNPHEPLLNHATLGEYPLGSVFKIVTMGAALEKAGFTHDTTRFCAGVWTGLGPAYVKSDWLPQGHGNISLHEALVQSCDIYFYQVGQQLNQIDHFLLPNYARAWGFGAPTGIPGVPEAAGVIPDPHWTLTTQGKPWVPGFAVDMAIGQGFDLVTPLQVAQMLAALADNGVMHQPYVVQRITAPNGAVARNFPPVVTRHLPISAAHREDILNAMLGVTTEAYGTATDKFAGFPWLVAGKTGTAQATYGQPDAWFVALAPADHPRIALVVMVEHGGEGSQVAAPLTRQILQTFFTKDKDLAGTGPSSGPQVLPVP